MAETIYAVNIHFLQLPHSGGADYGGGGSLGAGYGSSAGGGPTRGGSSYASKAAGPYGGEWAAMFVLLLL